MPASKTTHPLQIISSVSDSPLTSDHVERQSPPPSSTSLKSTPTTTSNAWLQQDFSFSFIPPLLLPLCLRSLWSWWFEFCSSSEIFKFRLRQDCSFSFIPPLLLPLLSTVVCTLPPELTSPPEAAPPPPASASTATTTTSCCR
ncbi:unnamed protein product [Lactuca virosa]|uniref:Uncharacterized protein n=1 Tax=Lactuca virosa TaxID=75947 RepID=A0AAU9PGP4_9ASTR|nr:unnamed protein product [Lactuca virosa]